MGNLKKQFSENETVTLYHRGCAQAIKCHHSSLAWITNTQAIILLDDDGLSLPYCQECGKQHCYRCGLPVADEDMLLTPQIDGLPP